MTQTKPQYKATVARISEAKSSGIYGFVCLGSDGGPWALMKARLPVNFHPSRKLSDFGSQGGAIASRE